MKALAGGVTEGGVGSSQTLNGAHHRQPISQSTGADLDCGRIAGRYIPMNEPKLHIGDRRASSWWSPTYNPSLHGNLVVSEWNFTETTGPRKCFLSADAMERTLMPGKTAKFQDLTFADCDFQGSFDHEPSILFDNCRFHNCDFGFSNWTRATFRKCEFRGSSFSLSSFKECEFRDCNWEKIGFSGSKTDFSKCFITNPTEFVLAGYSGTAPGKSDDHEHIAFQAYRLEETKAHIARNLLVNHEAVSDDGTFYETARLHDVQQVKFRLSKSLYFLQNGGFRTRIAALAAVIYWWTDLILLWAVGLTNGWGARVLQPLILLVLTYSIFGAIYWQFSKALLITQPWQTSFDVAIIAGYTNQTGPTVTAVLRTIIGFQLVLTIFFYTIFFSTAVARFSRSR